MHFILQGRSRRKWKLRAARLVDAVTVRKNSALLFSGTRYRLGYGEGEQFVGLGSVVVALFRPVMHLFLWVLGHDKPEGPLPRTGQERRAASASEDSAETPSRQVEKQFDCTSFSRAVWPMLPTDTLAFPKKVAGPRWGPWLAACVLLNAGLEACAEAAWLDRPFFYNVTFQRYFEVVHANGGGTFNALSLLAVPRPNKKKMPSTKT